ncbi:MAG: Spy/CpxP family protein refolding chaperone [Motiliproteus sp.]|nr:Spy/CpxP family protein refolding chaperone [Motiliproteus sp.]MCW9051339.1 Spy/CpxP family protein refolding chaperone [Motiliproteus sp.]
MKRKLIITTTALALAVAGTTAVAVGSNYGDRYCDKDDRMGSKGRYSEHSQRGGMMGAKMLQKLDWALELSAEQRDQIRDIMKDRQAEMTGKRDQMMSLRQSMKNLDPNTADYQTQVNKLAQQQADAARERVLGHAETYAAIHGVLTPEQQAEFKELKEKWGDKREKKHSRWN